MHAYSNDVYIYMYMMFANVCIWAGEGRQMKRNISRQLILHFPSFLLIALPSYLHL